MNSNIKEALMHIKGLNNKDFEELYRLMSLEYRMRLKQNETRI